MKHSNVQIVDNNNNNKYKKIIWIIVMTILMAVSSHMAFVSTWGTYLPYRYYHLIPWVAAGIAFSAAVYCLKERLPWIRGVLIIPMLAVFAPAGVTGGINGAEIWIDVIVYCWNTAHEGGLALLTVTGGNRDILAFAILVSVIIGELAFWFASDNALIQFEFYIVIWLLIQLFSGNINILASTTLIACGIIMAACGKSFYITFRSIVMSAVIFVAFIMAINLDTQELNGVVYARTYIREQIEDVRYGEPKLPEGNIREASQLKKAGSDMLTVWSEQEKNIYLKGYVGVSYDSDNGTWKKLSDAAFGGDNYGMLDWLYDKGFNPLSQSAQYYSLSERQDKPEVNSMKITVKNASRDYVYVPSSVNTFIQGKKKNNKDMNYAGKGLRGSSQYEISEISGSRPAELMVAEDWLTQPDSQEQQDYVEAEAVYRDFVYNNYTSVTKQYYALMNSIFWDDYEAQTDGVYGAVSRVREVLRERLTYNDDVQAVPEDRDPLKWYITDAYEGNAVIYASTAVLALRSYGIPARYVEGYYAAASDFEGSSNGQIVIDGDNAHAWVEVYFDGIGWQPIDVTPGFYYETAALQQMVNSPDSIHKTATVDDDKNSDAGRVIDDSNNDSRTTDEIIRKVWNTGLIILGIAALVIMAGVVFIAVVQVIYVIVGLTRRKKYIQSSSIRKATMLEQYIYQLLKVKGIEATLGWNTDEVDAVIATRFKNIEPGDYARVCVILEKVVYGGVELEGYELRTLEIFVREIFSDHSGDSWRTRIKIAFTAYKIR